jgi:SAM-dependent methyltransferase
VEPNQYKYMFGVEDRHWWYVGNHENLLKTLQRSKILHDGARVLDAGCGTGKWLEIIKNACHIFETGIDYNELALDLAKTRGKLNLKLADLNETLFEGSSFDLITSFDVICNSNINDSDAVKKFNGYLKDEGYLLLTVPAYKFLLSKHDAAVHQNKRYRRKQIKQLMENNGFGIVKLTYCVSLLFPLALVKRIIGNLFPAGDEEHNELKMPAPWINKLFLFVIRIENFMLRYISMPFGLSVMVLAKKTSHQGGNKI